MPVSDYECILLPTAPGYEYWANAKYRKQAMASLGIDVLTSINAHDECDSDSENEDIDFEKYMQKHGVPTKPAPGHPSSPTESPTSVTCPVHTTPAPAPVDIKRASSMPMLKRAASESSFNSRGSKRSARSADGSIGKSDDTYRRGVSLQSKYKRCTNA